MIDLLAWIVVVLCVLLLLTSSRSRATRAAARSADRGVREGGSRAADTRGPSAGSLTGPQ
jgi:hypothetical protein